MNLITAKSLDQVSLAGVVVDWQKHDGNIKLLTLTDSTGKTLTIKVANSYSDNLSILVPQPPKKEIRHVLHGEVAGIPIKKAYETPEVAEMVMSNFASHASNLTITPTEVVVDDDGEVVSDDFPF